MQRLTYLKTKLRLWHLCLALPASAAQDASNGFRTLLLSESMVPSSSWSPLLTVRSDRGTGAIG